MATRTLYQLAGGEGGVSVELAGSTDTHMLGNPPAPTASGTLVFRIPLSDMSRLGKPPWYWLTEAENGMTVVDAACPVGDGNGPGGDHPSVEQRSGQRVAHPPHSTDFEVVGLGKG